MNRYDVKVKYHTKRNPEIVQSFIDGALLADSPMSALNSILLDIVAHERTTQLFVIAASVTAKTNIADNE